MGKAGFVSVHPRGFEIQGHRGARGLFPENTLVGVRGAIGLGVRVIELDVAVTADGVPVVFHNVALNPDIVRDSGGCWITDTDILIRQLSRAALQAFDVGRLRPGSAYAAARHPDQIPADGSRIPTLLETLEVTAAAGVRADIELKTIPHDPSLTVAPSVMADSVIAVADQAGASDLIDIRSFDWRGLRAARARRADLPLTFLTSAETVAAPLLWWDRPLSASVPRTIAAECTGATWAPEHESLTRSEVGEAHACGLRVVPWTVNDPADMRRLIAWGVDGFCTDRPDRAIEIVRVAT